MRNGWMGCAGPVRVLPETFLFLISGVRALLVRLSWTPAAGSSSYPGKALEKACVRNGNTDRAQ